MQHKIYAYIRDLHATKNSTYTDKKPGTATKYYIRAYRITNGKKIYGPYSSVRTVK